LNIEHSTSNIEVSFARSGFTFIEILVVIVIIAILATFVGINVSGHPGEARMAAAKAQIATFRTAMQSYRMRQGDYPTQSQGLQALCRKPSVPPIPDDYPEEGYLVSRKLPDDPWGNPYVYLVPGPEGEAYAILTYGADGEPGGEGEKADISSLDM